MTSSDRFIRQVTLKELGAKGQERLLRSRIFVVGAGGLGSPALTYLAAAGVKTIAVADCDVVEEVNLHRQILHAEKNVKVPKAVSAKEGILRLNSDADVIVHSTRVDDSNARSLFTGFDLVLDCTDNFDARYVINRACVSLGIPMVHGSVLKFAGQVSIFCPAKDAPCYSCLYPEPPPPELSPTCVTVGILGTTPGIIGTIQALETIKLLAEFGEPLLGRLLLVDSLSYKMRTLEIKRDPHCKVCGS